MENEEYFYALFDKNLKKMFRIIKNFCFSILFLKRCSIEKLFENFDESRVSIISTKIFKSKARKKFYSDIFNFEKEIKPRAGSTMRSLNKRLENVTLIFLF
jgi:hypothetical protein